jgi:hypothetical protein
MSGLKKIAIELLIAFVLIQFIRPARNAGSTETATDITKAVNVPMNVLARLKTSCYDCHSNHTNYPWYANIQPFGWLLANHISEGKAELNFNEFGAYTKRRQLSKLKSIGGSLQDGSMPLWSYTLIHQEAKLSEEEKRMIMDWAEKGRDSLSKD